MNKKIIIFIIVIIIILIAVFFGQQAYSGKSGEVFIFGAKNQISAYITKGSNWVTAGIYPKISEGVQNGGVAIQNGVNQTKEKISDVENYFAGISNAIAGKNVTTCQP